MNKYYLVVLLLLLFASCNNYKKKGSVIVRGNDTIFLKKDYSKIYKPDTSVVYYIDDTLIVKSIVYACACPNWLIYNSNINFPKVKKGDEIYIERVAGINCGSRFSAKFKLIGRFYLEDTIPQFNEFIDRVPPGRVFQYYSWEVLELEPFLFFSDDSKPYEYKNGKITKIKYK